MSSLFCAADLVSFTHARFSLLNGFVHTVWERDWSFQCPGHFPGLNDLNAMWFLAVSPSHALLVLVALNPAAAAASSDPEQAKLASQQELWMYGEHLKASVSSDPYIVYGCPAPFQLRPDLHQAMQRDVQPGHASQFLPLQRAWELTAHNGGMYMNPLRHGHGLGDGPTTFQMVTGQCRHDYLCPCSQMSVVEFAALI